MTFEEIKMELCRIIDVSCKRQAELILKIARDIVGEGGAEMTLNETIAEINRLLDHCNDRQLFLILEIVQLILK